MNIFIFILAVITSSGELSLITTQVDQCPEKEAFVAEMEALKEKGEIIEWDANCVSLPAAKGQSI
jgi:hypothetical protein